MLNDPEGNPNNYRPLPQYGDLIVHRHSLYQNYNAFQSLLSRSSSKFSYTVAYTFSKALGIRGGDIGEGRVAALPADIRGTAYGVLGYDRAHVLNVGYSYLLPDFEDQRMEDGRSGGMAADRRLDVYQRRAAAGPDDDWRELRPRRDTRRWCVNQRSARDRLG